VKASVPFHGDNVETCVEFISRCPIVCQVVPFAISHLYFYSKKHRHFSVSPFREGRRSVVNTVELDVIESLRLHHQQCDIFSEIYGEIFSGLEPSFHTWRFIVFLPTGFPNKGVYYTLYEVQKVVSLRIWCCLELSTLKNFLFITEFEKKWTAEGKPSVCCSFRLLAWHPWLFFKISLVLSAGFARGPCIVTPAAPIQSQISDLGTGTRLSSRTHHTPLTEERAFSPSYAFRTVGHIEKHRTYI